MRIMIDTNVLLFPRSYAPDRSENRSYEVNNLRPAGRSRFFSGIRKYAW